MAFTINLPSANVGDHLVTLGGQWRAPLTKHKGSHPICSTGQSTVLDYTPENEFPNICEVQEFLQKGIYE